MSDYNIFYENQTVNVKISQTIRAEIANAIELLMNKNLVEFIWAKLTTEFSTTLAALFDYGTVWMGQL